MFWFGEEVWCDCCVFCLCVVGVGGEIVDFCFV